MEGEQLHLYMKFQGFKDFNLCIKNKNFANEITSLNIDAVQRDVLPRTSG